MQRIYLHVQGLVQGVGFRPFVYTQALKFGLFGFVVNSTNGVEIEVQGKSEDIELFIQTLTNSLPPLARIDKLEKKSIPLKNENSFKIEKSEAANTKNTPVLPDMAICEDCLSELEDKTDRRYKYPFINCTNCGPRYSIIKDIPYDRPFTSMAKFAMCEECKKEYENPLNRRYHAQPISCKHCGPTLTFYGKNFTCKDGAIEEISKLIKDGKIVAIKGVGGFHLVCDATNDKPIKRLREFKHRPHKPFAIMCKNEEMASLHVEILNPEKKALNSIEKPIVLLGKRENSTICDLVAPHTDRLGIFLPNTPLHVMLFDYIDLPIIATSANIKSEPIITKREDLDQRFGDLLSGILDYDREILHPCDDSLVQMIGDKKLFLRVSRGIAPLTLPQESKTRKSILAVGGQEKNAIAFYIDGRIVLTPYLGSMENIKTYELFEKTISSWKRFYGISFDKIIHDNHPSYETTKWAKSQGVETLHVNHYHAHILATLVDRKIPLDTKVFGVAWDGTGYGDDGSIWGGEFLVCKGREYERVAHFKPFKLLGSDKSVKNINRIAYSMLLDLEEDVNLEEFKSIEFLKQMHQKNVNAPLCSSVGRLFDAICYLATGLKEVSYDGQSGLLLESLYDKKIEDIYPLHVKDGVIDCDKMLLGVLRDRKNPNLVASKFLNTLADLILKLSKTYDLPLVLGGGVFQNRTLLDILHVKIKDKPIHFPQTLTPNDGSICVGQIAYGLV